MKYQALKIPTIFLFASIGAALNFSLIKFFNLELTSAILDHYWQYLDIESLINDPVNSILFLHSQPPMLNILVKFFSLFGKENIFHIFIIFNSICIGLTATVIFTIILQRTNSVSKGILFSFLYLVLPSTMLNGGYPFYPAMTAFMYSLIVLSFHLSDKKPQTGLLLISFSIILLSLTRGSFTFAHAFLFYLLYLIFVSRGAIKAQVISIVGLITLIFSIIVPLKNLYFYDFFGTSSWSPINIAYGVGIPRDKWYWMEPSEIQKSYPDLKCKNSYHFQDSALSKENGFPNFNSCLIIEHGRMIASESLPKYNPVIHAKYFLTNTAIYFSPSDKYRELINRKNIENYADLMSFAQLTVKISDKHEIRILLLIILLLCGYLSLSRKDKFLGICIAIIVTHYFSHAITDGYESQRFVFDIEFIFLILCGLMFQNMQLKKVHNS